jgi:glutamate synthase (NADPH) large chain
MDLNALTMQVNREHDACGIFSYFEKSGVESKKAIDAGLDALKAMRHRAGYVEGEGDGCGLLLDIPRKLWSDFLNEAGKPSEYAYSKAFYVGHCFLDNMNTSTFQTDSPDDLLANIVQNLEDEGLTVLHTRSGQVNKHVLGPSAARENPIFVQFAGMTNSEDDASLYKASLRIDSIPGVHVASLSRHTVVYKVVGNDETLFKYYTDLQDERCLSVFSLAHTRYSTNTATAFSRVQPFGLLGHNGEINTIARFYSEAGMLGIDVDANFSDSQMVNQVLYALTSERGWSLFEACELLFPPIVHEIKQMPDHLSDMYMFLRSLWGPFAQGPAGIMARFGNEAVFSVDALGLRPMWLIETEDAYCFSSEQGILLPKLWVAEPKPLSPGEKVGVALCVEPVSGARNIELFTYPDLQGVVYERISMRYRLTGEHQNLHFATPFEAVEAASHPARDNKPIGIRAAAYGFREDDYKLMEAEMQSGSEPIKSLGFDSPIAVLNPNLSSIADYLQETVAVVTNPAIDREREIEHFSTRTILGRRPSMAGLYTDAPRVEVQSPILLEELPADSGVNKDEIRNLAGRCGTLLYEDALELLRTSPNGTVEILIYRTSGESIQAALARFQMAALEAVQAGANVIMLDDRLQFKRGDYIDPFLVTASIHKSLLRPASKQGGEHLRRRTSLVLRSGGLRNLHDIVVAIGLGADAVVPYLMWEHAALRGSVQPVENLYKALCKGLEKVISTLGIHEIRGYERLFSAIGLSKEVAEMTGIPTFCAGETSGYTIAKMEADADLRKSMYEVETERELPRQKTYQLYPRIWKSAGDVGQGALPYTNYMAKLDGFERMSPINLRHVLSLKEVDESCKSDSVEDVDTTIDGHAYPFVISSMSFGSQGETSYRSYAEAAHLLNIVCLNGEGGEIKDMLGRYPRNRGRQIASGRFGVNAELCNNVYVLEIKIGQGAKPGEGGHLPGSKVTVQVANARNAAPGVDLISPSNNHDIYSIEDLAQVIFELKEVNPHAKIAVKVPIVPNIGTIAVGIVKAGADIVNLSGFDGGTGAARFHAIRHVGLPMEIGVKLAHDALCEAGLRNVAEIWTDGGMKSGQDVIKAVLLGANRVGFGTMAMVSIGCTGCRACHKDTCHVGIATQMTTVEEALAKGVKNFVPRELENSVIHMERFFRAVGRHVQELTFKLGAKRTQDLVGRRDLLQQVSHFDAVDLSWLIHIDEQHIGKGCQITTRTIEVEAESTAVSDAAASVVLSTGTDGGPVILGASEHSLSIKSRLSIRAVPRALGVRESGQFTRNRESHENRLIEHFAVAGAGFAAYHSVGMTSIAHGGAQDGVGKAAFGGKIVVLKERDRNGILRGGSVGKGLAYGAQHGLFIVQGNADARAGIRLSGADIIIGGEVEGHLQDHLGFIGARSNIKGFAFEYMTAGRAIVMGDPGPWMCSGMTGGTVYVRYDRSVGLTEAALRKRLAKGAKVSLRYLDANGDADVVELLTAYQKELRKHGQLEAAKKLIPLIQKPSEHFLMVKPGDALTDQDIATE